MTVIMYQLHETRLVFHCDIVNVMFVCWCLCVDVCRNNKMADTEAASGSVHYGAGDGWWHRHSVCIIDSAYVHSVRKKNGPPKHVQIPLWI